VDIIGYTRSWNYAFECNNFRLDLEIPIPWDSCNYECDKMGQKGATKGDDRTTICCEEGGEL